MVLETQPCSTLTKDRTTPYDMVDPEVRSRGQHSVVGDEQNDPEGNITVGKTRMRTITVGGVPLTEYMKLKKRTVGQKTPQSGKKRKKSPGKEKKTTPSVVNMRKIWEYMKDKKTKMDDECEDKGDDILSNEDNQHREDNLLDTRSQSDNDDNVEVKTIPRMRMKTTFGEAFDSNKKISVSDRIQRFSELERGNDCVIGSGRCATHNVRIVRILKDVRQKYLDENGLLRWRLSETTVLECPRAFSRQNTEDCSDVSILPETVGTNGNTEVISTDANYQPDRRDNNVSEQTSG